MSQKSLSPSQKVLLQSKWSQIRKIAYKLPDAIRSIEGDSLNLSHLFFESYPQLEMMRFLLDRAASLKNFSLSKKSTKAMLFEYDSSLVAQHRNCFREIFKIFSLLDNWHTRDVFVSQMLVGNFIALLPYFDFEQGDSIQILRWIEGEWRLVNYQIAHIPLVEKKIVAYGLEPKKEPKAHPLLVFQGTPYPAAAGFFEAMWSNLHPTKSVGEDLFQKGKPALDAWMEGRSLVECFGMSLGGALAYHAGFAYEERLDVNAYVAPGLIPIKKNRGKICGRAFFHFNDLIKLVGFHPESDRFELFAVLTNADFDFVQAHAKPPGIEPTIIVKVDPKHENKRGIRYVFTFLKEVISAPVFLILLLIRGYLKLREKVQRYTETN